MEIKLKIIQVLLPQEGVSQSGKQWKIQAYVGETQEQYPRKVCFEVFGEDRINNNPCKEGQIVTVSFDIESREFNGRWYTSIRAWKVQPEEQVAQTEQVPQSAQIFPEKAQAQAQEQVQEPTSSQQEETESGELPF